MSGLRGDELVEALVPLATDLVKAVHALNPDVVADVLGHAAALTGDPHVAASHLLVVLAGMVSEDHSPSATLGWTRAPGRYRALRATCDSLTASLRAGQEALEQRADIA